MAYSLIKHVAFHVLKDKPQLGLVSHFTNKTERSCINDI